MKLLRQIDISAHHLLLTCSRILAPNHHQHDQRHDRNSNLYVPVGPINCPPACMVCGWRWRKLDGLSRSLWCGYIRSLILTTFRAKRVVRVYLRPTITTVYRPDHTLPFLSFCFMDSVS